MTFEISKWRNSVKFRRYLTFESLLFLDIIQDESVLVGEDYIGLDNLAPGNVRAGHHGRLLDGLVLYQGGLHLEGSNPVAGGDDQIVLPGEEPEVAVLVLNSAVSSQVVISTEGVGRGRGVFTVTLVSNEVRTGLVFISTWSGRIQTKGYLLLLLLVLRSQSHIYVNYIAVHRNLRWCLFLIHLFHK